MKNKRIIILLVLSLFLTSCACGEKSVEEQNKEYSSLAEEYIKAGETTANAENHEEKEHKVKVLDTDGTVLQEITVPYNGTVDLSNIEVNDKNNFQGWLGDNENIKADEVVQATGYKTPQGFAFLASDVVADNENPEKYSLQELR